MVIIEQEKLDWIGLSIFFYRLNWQLEDHLQPGECKDHYRVVNTVQRLITGSNRSDER